VRWRLAFGAGVEAASNRNWSAKIEYLHVDREDTGYFMTKPLGFGQRAGGVPLDNQIIRAGVNYRLDWGRPAA
jgi:opacity protein-like surface antigen